MARPARKTSDKAGENARSKRQSAKVAKKTQSATKKATTARRARSLKRKDNRDDSPTTTTAEAALDRHTPAGDPDIDIGGTPRERQFQELMLALQAKAAGMDLGLPELRPVFAKVPRPSAHGAGSRRGPATGVGYPPVKEESPPVKEESPPSDFQDLQGNLDNKTASASGISDLSERLGFLNLSFHPDDGSDLQVQASQTGGPQNDSGFDPIGDSIVNARDNYNVYQKRNPEEIGQIMNAADQRMYDEISTQFDLMLEQMDQENAALEAWNAENQSIPNEHQASLTAEEAANEQKKRFLAWFEDNRRILPARHTNEGPHAGTHTLHPYYIQNPWFGLYTAMPPHIPPTPALMRVLFPHPEPQPQLQRHFALPPADPAQYSRAPMYREGCENFGMLTMSRLSGVWPGCMGG